MAKRFLLVKLAAAAALAAQDFTGNVLGITDGDTIRVMHNGAAERVRLWVSTARNRSNRSARGRSSSPRI
jgi:hypothetical protein